MSWADRIAYVCHDFEDAVHAGIIAPDTLPPIVAERCGTRRSRQLDAFIGSVVDAVASSGRVGMTEALAEALAEFRRFNYERIYMRPASLAQSVQIIRVLGALVEHFSEVPNTLPFDDFDVRPVRPTAGSPDAVREAVTYVAGMTDRYAFTTAIELLGWDPHRLPIGVDWYR